MDTIIKDKEPDTSYMVTGKDYSLLIYPIGRNIEDSNVHLDFSECEKIFLKNFQISN